ncbi:ABC transporter permease [Azospirillum canadense]|uniref:ABC transporter permease n=1 Tax=Azospirillum canadense TaxID=403962 RepID=UPI0022280990|nr:ABC transporter permease [Azospirillum canadense]MCW2240520.1 ABC-type dipeptide/oligopeptide/nickel transport system permease component [Azospirillum canadense]
MGTLLVRRLAALVPVILGVSVAVFLMLHAVPGDPAQIIAGQEASVEDVAQVRHSFGLDQPLAVQYARFLSRAVVGDFGTSFRTKRPVIDEIGDRYGYTLLLGAAAIAFAVAVGILVGVVAAVFKHSWVDNVCLLVSLVGVSVPNFFLGLLLMLGFSVWLQLFPLTGADTAWHVVLPAVTLGLPSAAVIARIMRSSLIEILGNDYIRTARAKGLPEWLVVGRHALRNALMPVVTVVGLQMGYLLGGAVIVETVFAWPGLGRLTVQAIAARDFPVVQAAVLVLAATFVLVNLLTDLVYSILDPRVTLS